MLFAAKPQKASVFRYFTPFFPDLGDVSRGVLPRERRGLGDEWGLFTVKILRD
jgi:hypothetical protein